MWSSLPSFRSLVGFCVNSGSKAGRRLQFAGQGGAEEWLGLGQVLKDSLLHGVPLGLAGGPHGVHSGFSVPAGGVRGYPTPFARGVSRKAKSQDGIWLGEFSCLLWEAKR